MFRFTYRPQLPLSLVLLFSWVLLGGCFSSHDNPLPHPAAPQECTLEGEKAFVYHVMHDTYLWYDKVPSLDYNDTAYPTPEALLEALKYSRYDKWSYITTKKAYNTYFEEGSYIGYGFRFALLPDRNDSVVLFVYPGSPADGAGLERGDHIEAINGHTIAQIIDQNLTQIFGAEQIGVVSALHVRKRGGGIVDMNLSKAVVSLSPVLYTKIFDTAEHRVGYLLFNSFIEPAKEQLERTFDDFKTHGVDTLILDLRYNGGGRLDVAGQLCSLIAGPSVLLASHRTKTMLQIRHNDRYRSKNWTMHYPLPSQNALGVHTLYVITTEDTCSASEAVINALRASSLGIEVHTIGSATCGKPVGMYGEDFCDKHIAPIEFALYNSDGVGEYFDGIDANCSASDDLNHTFGDLNESMLKEALTLIETGSCSRSRMFRSAPRRFTPLEGFRREIGAF